MNLKDFPNEILQKYEIEAHHPDEFILHLIDLAPDAVMDAAEPPKSQEPAEVR